MKFVFRIATHHCGTIKLHIGTNDICAIVWETRKKTTIYTIFGMLSEQIFLEILLCWHHIYALCISDISYFYLSNERFDLFNTKVYKNKILCIMKVILIVKALNCFKFTFHLAVVHICRHFEFAIQFFEEFLLSFIWVHWWGNISRVFFNVGAKVRSIGRVTDK